MGGRGSGIAFFGPMASSIDKNARESLCRELKELFVSELNLAGRDPAQIRDDAPLFVREDGGLGLDSLDALQIAMLVEERFGVRVPEGDEARPIFTSIATLADFVSRERAAASASP